MGAGAFCFPKSNPNPLAPAWMFPSEWLDMTPAGYRDEYQVYPITQVLTASQQITAEFKFDTGGQCNFYWNAIGIFLFGGAGLPSVRIRDSEGFMMLNTRVALANDAPFGRTDHVTPIFVAHRISPGAKLALDFNETGGAAGVTVVVYLHGYKRWVQDSEIDWRGGSMGPSLPPGAGGLPRSGGMGGTV